MRAATKSTRGEPDWPPAEWDFAADEGDLALRDFAWCVAANLIAATDQG